MDDRKCHSIGKTSTNFVHCRIFWHVLFCLFSLWFLVLNNFAGISANKTPSENWLTGLNAYFVYRLWYFGSKFGWSRKFEPVAVCLTDNAHSPRSHIEVTPTQPITKFSRVARIRRRKNRALSLAKNTTGNNGMRRIPIINH